MPITYYSSEEYAAIKDENEKLWASNTQLEEMRPMWAKGYTSDSVAAQCFSNALNQIYKHLDVTNQTDAMNLLVHLTNKAKLN